MVQKRPTKRAVQSVDHTPKYVFIFAICIVLIGVMLWQILTALSSSTYADGRGRGKMCRGANGSFFSFCKAGDSHACNAGCSCEPFNKNFKVGVCRGDGTKTPKPCKDVPKPEKVKLTPGASDVKTSESEKDTKKDTETETDKEGPCDPKLTGVPVPPGKVTPPVLPGGGVGTGTKACGIVCTQDSDCMSGFCNPAGFPICPTSAPGQPIEGCSFLPPDPTVPSVCAPIICKADNTNANNCACPATGTAMR